MILVIMAAGIGSRFGKGIKQLEKVGPNGEIIMDYSIYDALEAGFDKVVFIIRKDIEKDFKEIIGNRISKIVDVEYVFQELDSLPKGYINIWNRTKPWGTGQAVLSARNVVDGPFVVINADDYYGKEAFAQMNKYLKSNMETDICMPGFVLKNTLSDNGGVTRGICKVDAQQNLIEVKETYEIQLENGILKAKDELGNSVDVDLEQQVSMNMWGLYPEFFDVLEKGFQDFLDNLPKEEQKKEYLLPIIIDKLVQEQETKVKVLKTNDKWFGITYQEDKESVKTELKRLSDSGVYDNIGRLMNEERCSES